MKIIIVGMGKVGQSLAIELSAEGNDITVIDENEESVEEVTGQYDLMGIVGNGSIYSTQIEAGIEAADLLIAVTGSDELNLLCCLIAKKAGNCHTIARVRNHEFETELSFIKEELGLAMVITPELAAAREIANTLKFPSAIEVNTFAKSRVELLKFRVPDRSVLINMPLSKLSGSIGANVLICAIERDDELIIPDGKTELKANDIVSVVGASKDANEFFKRAGIVSNQIKSLLIVGGGSTGFYLAKSMLANGVRVKVIEKNRRRCEELCDLLPKATIVHGDASDKDLLLEEGIDHYESVAALTNLDEENILLSLYARKVGTKKVVTRLNRVAFDEVLRELDLDTVIYPKKVTTEHIIRYVRSMKNSIDSNVETLHKIIDDKAEALEFVVRNKSKVTDTPLQDLKIKKGILIACISRDGKVIIPRGSDQVMIGDSVIVITQQKKLYSIEDIISK